MKINKKMRLVQSKFLQFVESEGLAIIWHSLFGKPKIVSKEMLSFLSVFNVPKSLDSLFEEYEIGANEKKCIKEMVLGYFLISEDFDERKFLAERMKVHEVSVINGSLIDYLGLKMSDECNFRCSYCIHFNNLEISDSFKNAEKYMSFENAKEAIDSYLMILRQHGKKTAEINFGGGEPLLAWPVIEDVLNYCNRKYSQEFIFRFTINSNASLISKKIAKKIKEHNVGMGISLDGLRQGNDSVRFTKTGKGTFDAILKGIDNLSSQGCCVDGISVTVNENNFPFIDEDIILWAKERKMVEVRIDIDVINMVEIPIDNIVDKLMRIRKLAKVHGIAVPGFWSRPVENLNKSSIDEHIAFCGGVHGNSICVSPSRNIYGCGYSTVKLGDLDNINSLCDINGNYHHFVQNRFVGRMEMCKNCIIEGQCGGGCNITQEFASAKGTVKIERMCDFYRKMTKEILLEQLREIGHEANVEDTHN